MRQPEPTTAEGGRLAAEARREPDANWKRWGTYLAERQWGTVREDYSTNGGVWNHFTHDDAVWRTYRWGEDGLLGFTDRQCRLCFAVSLWNGVDPILKERLFGLAGHEGNHGEDVKEAYFYIDATPTHSYCKALYKYPQTAFPYQRLRDENHRRSRGELEYELTDTGIFDDNRYFDVYIEYAKALADDILIRITIHNRGKQPAKLDLLPTLWFRNTWSWEGGYENDVPKPRISQRSPGQVAAEHATLGNYRLDADTDPLGNLPLWLFTENETNTLRRSGAEGNRLSSKDAFHQYVVQNRKGAINLKPRGTKAAARYSLNVPAEGSVTIRLRLTDDNIAVPVPFSGEFDQIVAKRIA